MAWRSTSRAVACLCVAMSIGGCSPQIDQAIHDRTTCDFPKDEDFGERSYEIVALSVPSSPDVGFDVDGRTSKANDVDGCFYPDGPGGVDTAFTSMLAELAPRLEEEGLDIVRDVEESAVPLQITFTLGRWNGTASDDCVSLQTRTRWSTGGGFGRLRRGVLELRGAMVVDLLSRSECDGADDCAVPSTPAFMTRARLVFGGGEDGMEQILGTAVEEGAQLSIMGGYVEKSSFLTSMYSYTATSSADTWDDVEAIVASHLDIPGIGLRAGCMQTSATGTSADAVSIALIPTGVRRED